MLYFCTLFDRNYLYKGLALHASMVRHIRDFKLCILALDDETHAILSKLKLKNVVLIKLKNFEDPQLLKVKSTRTPLEYYWTITPSLPLYLLKKYPRIDMITYVDADVYFYSSPEPIFKELGSDSILITEHRFPRFLQYKIKESGRFNVQFLTFRNNTAGRRVLSWWRARCLEWCYFRYEDGKLGDQLYLNQWPEKFLGVHILQHSGGALAPWNVLNYRYRVTKGGIIVDNDRLVFYHFHGMRLLDKNRFIFAPAYALPGVVLQHIYKPYTKALQQAISRVKRVKPTFESGFSRPDNLWQQVSSFLFAQKLRLLKVIYG